jgi:hypothetical protein
MANQPKTLIELDEFRGRRIWIDAGSQQRLVEISAKHELAQSERNAVECRNLHAAFHQLLALSAKLGRKDSKVFRTSIVLPEELIYRMRKHYPMFSFSQWCGTALADAADELDRLSPQPQPQPQAAPPLERQAGIRTVVPPLSQDKIDTISKDRQAAKKREVPPRPSLETAVAGALGINTDDWDEGESK